MYPHFLERADDYSACESYWAVLCGAVLQEAGESDLWAAWVNRSRDANPIFDLICPARRLAFRVVQVLDDGAPRRFAWWTKTIDVGVDTLPNGEYHELVFRCTLTTQTADLARPLFSDWVANGRVPDKPV